MNPIIDKLKGIYREYYSNIQAIKNIFVNYFGEDYVDVQNITEEQTFLDRILENEFTNYCYPSSFRLPAFDFEKIKYKALKDYTNQESLPYYIEYLISSFSVSRILNFIEKTVILLHFPEITITNEKKLSTKIQDLYVKVTISPNGTLSSKFEVSRSTFSFEHYYSGYIHSHVPVRTESIPVFKNPCTGSGPINNTIRNLMTVFNPDIWELFCVELDKYLKVESLNGGPYIRIENLGKCTISKLSDNVDSDTLFRSSFLEYDDLKEFERYFINKCIKDNSIKINYINDKYNLAMSLTEYYLLVSNYFIDWFNNIYCKKYGEVELSRLVSNRVLHKMYLINNSLYFKHEKEVIQNIQSVNNTTLFKFKGKDVKLQINNSEISSGINNITLILNIENCNYILTKLIYLFNFKYGKEEFSNKEIKYIL